MNSHTNEEKNTALEKLPKPISGFLKSQTITDIYVGIAQKLKLNFRQEGLMSEVANATLLGLEPEHALEANLHQMLPELSNTAMRELAADINDRIFKEAQRRLRENILEPEEVWDEDELGPKPTKEENEEWRARERQENENPLTDDELRALVEEEKRKKLEQEEAEEEAAAKTRPAITAEDASNSEEPDKLTPSIVEQRLGIPTKTPLTNVEVPSDSKPGLKNTEQQGLPASTPVEPEIRAVEPKPQAPAAPAPKPAYKGVDPYREPVE